MINKKKLKISLARMGIPACGMAKSLGIDRATLSRICNGWIEPPPEIKKKIAEHLGLRVSDLWISTEGDGVYLTRLADALDEAISLSKGQDMKKHYALIRLRDDLTELVGNGRT